MVLPIIQKLEEHFKEHQPDPRWDVYRTERTDRIMSMILESVGGDILEIGAHSGRTTSIFCTHGKKFSRHVYVIDPWDGRQQGNNQAYSAFVNNTKKHDNLTVHKMGSESGLPLEEFQKHNIKFAFILIDGLHSYQAVKNDIIKYVPLLVVGGVLCIDDWSGPYAFCGEIRKATEDHLAKNIRPINHPSTFIEQYFIKLPEEA